MVLTIIKILLNSTVLTIYARFSCFDLNDFYYGTPMEQYDYTKLHMSTIPDKIVHQCKLNALVTPKVWVYLETRKVMPSLKQTVQIANKQLTSHLEKFGYRPCKYTPGLWTHDSHHVTF